MYVFCMHLARALFDGIFRRELALSSRTSGLTLHFAQRELYATYVCRHGYFSTYSYVLAAHVKDYWVCLASLEYIFERARARPLSKLTRSFSPPRSNFVRIMRVWGPSRGTLSRPSITRTRLEPDSSSARTANFLLIFCFEDRIRDAVSANIFTPRRWLKSDTRVNIFHLSVFPPLRENIHYVRF